jgi:hypothetical protein
MYINLSVFVSSGLEPSDLLFLAAINQTHTDWLIENLNEDRYKRFEVLSLLKHIKQKSKKEHPYVSLRLSDDAKQLLADLSYEGDVDEETIIIGDWLIKVYKAKSGGIVKNKTEIKRRIQWFKTITQISGNRLGVLFQCFIQDTYNPQDGLTVKEFMEKNPRGVLSNMCDNICWSPTSLYDKHKTLDKSPLWQYYSDNTEYINKVWESKDL